MRSFNFANHDILGQGIWGLGTVGTGLIALMTCYLLATCCWQIVLCLVGGGIGITFGVLPWFKGLNELK
jgi:hypothetical protein